MNKLFKKFFGTRSKIKPENEITKKFKLPVRYKGLEENVWSQFSQLAKKHCAFDLGLGYPDYAPPKFVTKALKVVAANQTTHQYSRTMGNHNLTKSLADLYSPLIRKNINPNTEILVSSGQVCLYSAIFGLVQPGDQVILLEPFYEAFESIVKAAGGICKYVTLRYKKIPRDTSSDRWMFNINELSSAFNRNTKMFILNTPHNPLGKVFTRKELRQIAGLCNKYNVVCLSDEVYEFVVYKPKEHVRMADFADMWDRTITVGSADKTLGVTGWKIAWAYGPANLINNMVVVHQNLVSSSITPIQEALASIYKQESERIHLSSSFFNVNAKILEGKRNFLAKAISNAGMTPIVPDGGYFILADCSEVAKYIDLKEELDEYLDVRMSKWMVKNLGLMTIPASYFFSGAAKKESERYIRFCFWKSDEALEHGAKLLMKLKTGEVASSPVKTK